MCSVRSVHGCRLPVWWWSRWSGGGCVHWGCSAARHSQSERGDPGKKHRKRCKNKHNPTKSPFRLSVNQICLLYKYSISLYIMTVVVNDHKRAHFLVTYKRHSSTSLNTHLSWWIVRESSVLSPNRKVFFSSVKRWFSHNRFKFHTSSVFLKVKTLMGV